jgi:hypothetical protein
MKHKQYRFNFLYENHTVCLFEGTPFWIDGIAEKINDQIWVRLFEQVPYMAFYSFLEKQ